MNKIIFAYWEHFDDLRKVNIYDEKQRSVEESAFLIDMNYFGLYYLKRIKVLKRKCHLRRLKSY